MGDEKVVYLSTLEAAKKLKCSQTTVRRVAKRHAVGIHVAGNRLVALAERDVLALKDLIHATSGNPNWIAKRGRTRTARGI